MHLGHYEINNAKWWLNVLDNICDDTMTLDAQFKCFACIWVYRPCSYTNQINTFVSSSSNAKNAKNQSSLKQPHVIPRLDGIVVTMVMCSLIKIQDKKEESWS